MKEINGRKINSAALLLGICFAAVVNSAISLEAAEKICLAASGYFEDGDAKIPNPERSLELATYAYGRGFSVASAAVPRWARQPSLKEFKKLAIAHVRSNPNAALILYSGDDDHLCAFIWSAATISLARPFQYVRIPSKRGTIETFNRQFRTHIIGKSTGTGRLPVSRRGAVSLTAKTGPVVSIALATEARRRLSEIFFPKRFRPLLRNVQNVSIISFRGMSEVPVAALEPLGDDQHTVDLFSFNYLAFPSELFRSLTPWRPQFDQPLVIGNPDSTKDPDWKFSDLPGAEAEAKHVVDALGGKALLRSEATLHAFRKNVDMADYIHIAAHALSDPQKPKENGFIRLSDSRLTVFEAQWLKLSRQPLVVLSACQTATGRVEESGIVGMGRAFQAAGATPS